MKEVYSFIPEPHNQRAIAAVSALARAMKEMNKVAIVRCVWRQGQSSVVLGVLTPNISEKAKKVGFYSKLLSFCNLNKVFLYLHFVTSISFVT